MSSPLPQGRPPPANGRAADAERFILDTLSTYVRGILARSMYDLARSRARVRPGPLQPQDCRRLLEELEAGLRVFVSDTARRDRCRRELAEGLLPAEVARKPGAPAVIAIKVESDIVVARHAGRELCRVVGFADAAQLKVATVISELARNIVQYAGEGTVTLTELSGRQKGVEVVAVDAGPGISNLELVLSGAYCSKTDMGMGLLGTRRLMDETDIQTAPGKGTRVTTRKYLMSK